MSRRTARPAPLFGDLPAPVAPRDETPIELPLQLAQRAPDGVWLRPAGGDAYWFGKSEVQEIRPGVWRLATWRAVERGWK